MKNMPVSAATKCRVFDTATAVRVFGEKEPGNHSRKMRAICIRSRVHRYTTTAYLSVAYTLCYIIIYCVVFIILRVPHQNETNPNFSLCHDMLIRRSDLTRFPYCL